MLNLKLKTQSYFKLASNRNLLLLRSPVELHHRRLTNFFFLVSTSHILYHQSSLGVRVCYEVCSGIPSPLVARSHGSSSTILINEGIKIT